MKDRIAQYPGRLQFTPVASQSNTYDISLSDMPIEEGTPLNKMSILQDGTAALYNLESDATLDDVLKLSIPQILENEKNLTTPKRQIEDAKNKLKNIIANGTDHTTATPYDILKGKTAYSNLDKLEGNIKSIPETRYTPTAESQYIVGGNYLSGDQIIEGDENLKPENIISGSTIFGVKGVANAIASDLDFYEVTFEVRSMYHFGILVFSSGWSESSYGKYYTFDFCNITNINPDESHTILVPAPKEKSVFKNTTLFSIVKYPLSIPQPNQKLRLVGSPPTSFDLTQKAFIHDHAYLGYKILGSGTVTIHYRQIDDWENLG